jgi:hypothetical protein
MSSATVDAAMVPVSRCVRAYFAPYDTVANAPTVFDPGQNGGFSLDAPPPPWVDLGWIGSFQRTSGTKVQVLSSGAKGASVGQFRKSLEASVEFDFQQWGKLQMAIAGGSQHMNVLTPEPSASPRPSGGIPTAAVSILAGSSASQLNVGPGIPDLFDVGDMIAVDLDYQQEVGYVGSGIPGAYVSDPTAVLRDKDYVRRVTFNVARVAEKTTTSLLLAQPLLADAPVDGCSAQKIVAFVDREGGSFFQEWSALFVWEEESGGRICFHYPRLSPSRQGSGATGQKSETPIAISGTLAIIGLHACFLALGSTDPNDGETVLCYRSYFPATKAALY